MAITSNKNHSYLSYFRTFLSEWSLLIKHASSHLSNINQKTKPNSTVLNDQHIKDIIDGSFGYFYREHINTYMLIKRECFEFRTANETAFTSAKKNIPLPSFMPDRKIETVVQTRKTAEKTFNTSASAAITSKLKQLNKYFKENLITQKRLHKAAYNETIKALEQITLPTNDLDKGGLCADESLSEIMKRFEELNLKPYNVSVKNNCYFTRSLELKLYLTIYAVLGRKQLPHSDKDIQNHLKKLKGILKKCRLFEQKTNESQDKKLEAINQSFCNKEK